MYCTAPAIGAGSWARSPTSPRSNGCDGTWPSTSPPIAVPPLSERTDDLPAFTEYHWANNTVWDIGDCAVADNLLVGDCASPGVATGTARVIRDPSVSADLAAGDVLVPLESVIEHHVDRLGVGAAPLQQPEQLVASSGPDGTVHLGHSLDRRVPRERAAAGSDSSWL